MLGVIKFHTVFAALVIPIVVAVRASPARAQVYLPPQGESTASVLFQDMGVTYHFLPTTPIDRGHIRAEDTSCGCDLWVDRQNRGQLRLAMDRIQVHWTQPAPAPGHVWIDPRAVWSESPR